MLVIRLRRIGRTHDPHYRVVVAEHTAPIQGKFIAEVGHYHPKSKELVIETEVFTSWLNKGAKPSNTVAKLATRLKIEHKQIAVIEEKGQPKKKAQERAAAKADKAASAKAEAEKPAEVTEPVEETTPEETPEAATEPAEEVAEAPAEEASSEEAAA